MKIHKSNDSQPVCPRKPSNRLYLRKQDEKTLLGEQSSLKKGIPIKINLDNAKEIILFLGYFLIGVINAILSYIQSYILHAGEMDIGPLLTLLISPLWPMYVFFDVSYLLQSFLGVVPRNVDVILNILLRDALILSLTSILLILYLLFYFRNRKISS
ncbi:MAG: hypothetical protein ACFFC7_29740 [Candidatus Hermodarchaeota archaeon]